MPKSEVEAKCPRFAANWPAGFELAANWPVDVSGNWP
jgi:hypothetical protein